MLNSSMNDAARWEVIQKICLSEFLEMHGNFLNCEMISKAMLRLAKIYEMRRTHLSSHDDVVG